MMPPDAGSGQSQRFPKRSRLRKRRDYLHVQQLGQKIPLQDLLVIVLQREHDGLRLGITTSRKVGSAVRRNRYRRVIREAWRREMHRLPSGYDIVLVVKRNAARADFQSIRRQIDQLGKKLKHETRTTF